MQFSDVAMNLKASEIRELLKLTTKPEIISFAGGLPAPELFPMEELRQATNAVIDKEGRAPSSTVRPKAICPCASTSVNG